ncbi:hypothetical protein GCM10010178_65880 [Lentzea flava]|uniref:Uncharacterized protein n=1 Tax=Lentzea flava TaxID=103732 RepID=A0ABQ2V3B3_9PSEU|nr:hypothetical protein GCM10010178_65880 [Lentzea flava]
MRSIRSSIGSDLPSGDTTGGGALSLVAADGFGAGPWEQAVASTALSTAIKTRVPTNPLTHIRWVSCSSGRDTTEP